MHAALSCASATLSGGDCGSGALAGGFTKITSPYIAEFAGSDTNESFKGKLRDECLPMELFRT